MEAWIRALSRSRLAMLGVDQDEHKDPIMLSLTEFISQPPRGEYDRRMPPQVARPTPDEIPDFFKGYVSEVSEADGVAALERQQAAIAAIGRLTPEQAAHRYADGKWTVSDVVGHMMDGERIFIYRLLRIARGDRTPLPAFDENEYAKTANAGARSPADLAAEMATIRASAISLAKSVDEHALSHVGTVRAGEITARAQLFVIAGHFQHHLNILRDRYKLPL